LSSALWILCIAIHQHRVTCHKELFPQKYEFYYFLTSFGFPFFTLVVCWGTGAFGNIGFWCWITRDYNAMRWYFYYVPLTIVLIALVGIFFDIHGFIKSHQDDLHEHETYRKKQKTKKIEMLVYILVFIAVQAPGFLNRMYDAVYPDAKEKFFLSFLTALCFPLQGFINSLIFLKSRAVSRHLRAFGSKYSKIDRILMWNRKKFEFDDLEKAEDQKSTVQPIKEIISKSNLRFRSSVYSQGYHVFVSTWNLHNQPLNRNIVADWIPLDFKPIIDDDDDDRENRKIENLIFHVVAVGVQECIQENWFEYISDRLYQVSGDSYSLIGFEGLGEIRLAVWALKSINVSPLSIQKTFEANGFLNVMNNKGGVCISFKLEKLSFCFVNVHLAAHRGVSYSKRRNRNIKQLFNRLVWNQEELTGGNEVDLTSRHHVLFLLGDLNYRINDKMKKKDAMQLVLSRDYQSLFQEDQLKIFKDCKMILSGFKEPNITFPPTYKYLKGTAEYSHKRLPGWCDRILYKHKNLLTVHQHYYESPKILHSDHFPVSSVFSVAISPSVELSTPSHSNNQWTIEFSEIKIIDAVSADGVRPSEIVLSFFGDSLGPHSFYRTPVSALSTPSHPNEFVFNSGIIPKLSAFGKYNMKSELELACVYLVARDVELVGEDDVIGHSQIELYDKFCGQNEVVSFTVPMTRSTAFTGTLHGKIRVYNRLGQEEEEE
jgi:hypothetical protein